MNRKLRDRLSKLESPQGAELSRSDHMLLVSILGRRDSLYWPWRWTHHDKTPHCEIRRRQREYLAGQIGIAVRADGAHQWKDASAARQRLISAGMITANHSSGQVQSVFLTPLGEATARALVGSRLHSYEGSHIVLVLLVLKGKESGCTAVRESVLLNVPSHGNPESWNERTELMLPLLTHGSVEAQPDTQGRILYCPRDVPPPPIIVVDVEPHDDFDDAYIGAFNAERQVLATVEPRDQHEIMIPIPASVCWPADIKGTNDEEK